MSPQKARPAKRGAARAGEPLSVRVAGIERALAGSRKRSKTLNDSEHLLKLLPDAVLVHCDGKVVFANDAAARMLGAAKPNDLIGRDTLAFIHPDNLESVKQRVEQMVGRNMPTEKVREKRVRLDGKSVSVESLAIPCEWHGRRGILAVNRDLTEKKRAKIALLASEERYQQLVELLPDAVYIHIDGKIVYVNPAAVKLFGARGPEDLIGRPYADLTHSDDQMLLRARVQNVLSGEGVNHFREQRRRRLDGSEFMAEVAAARLVWKDQKAALVVVRDLSERTRADAALRDSEERYRQLVELLPDAVYIHSGNTIVYVNAAGIKVFGAEHADQILGRDYLDFCHPDDRARIRARHADLIKFGESSEFATRRRMRLDGSEFPAETAAQRLFWKDRPATLVVVRDLTEAVHAQESIEAKSALLEATVNALNEGLWAFDNDLRMLTWNERAVEILGFPAEMFYVGASFEDFIRYASARGDYGPGDPQEHLTSRIAIARSGNFESFERKAANGRIIETRVHPMKDGGMVATFMDITERKIAEQARETLTRRLAGQASELKRSNEELEQFAYIASHDLQEPLRMVSSYCQLLERRYKDKLDGDAGEFIRFAVDGANRMQTLINDLLAFSRVGRHGKAMQPVSLQAALDIACANLKRAIAETNVEIGADPLPQVMGDDTQLAQLFQNLIENAIKFRREEPARIRVSARQTAEGFEIAVQDNGIGMEPQYAERIFLMFQRLHDRTKFAGNGIGLAICKKIVERHDGRIWVESEPGKGSTFKFTLMRG
jgi:PAS domain S-box-containing protein